MNGTSHNLIFSISPGVFWPYFFGAAILIVGLVMLPTDEVRQARGLDKLIPFGHLFFAIPMAIFGADQNESIAATARGSISRSRNGGNCVVVQPAGAFFALSKGTV